MPCQTPGMNMVPIIIILSALVLVVLISAALRVTIRRDRAAIKGDMDEQHEIDAYNERWGNPEQDRPSA